MPSLFPANSLSWDAIPSLESEQTVSHVWIGWHWESQVETTKIIREMSHPVILAPLCTTAKTENQVNCRTDEWIDTDNGVRVHNTIFLSNQELGNNVKLGHRKESRDDHSKWIEADRERQVSYDITPRWNLKIDKNELVAWRHRLRHFQSPGYKDGGMEKWATSD